VEGEFTSKSQNQKFSQMMKEYETPMFLGCKKEHNKLHVILTLLQMKSSNDWSDKGFNKLLQFFRNLLPKDNVLPQNTYQAKKTICPLELEVEKIYECQNYIARENRRKISNTSLEMTWGRIKKTKECQLRWHGISP
jgi:hypothetical protein